MSPLDESTPRRATTTLASIWSWGVVTTVSVVGFFVYFASYLVTRPFDRDQRLTGRLFRLGSVVSSKLNPLWRFRIHGPTPRGGPGGAVVVGNHQSQADPFLISHLPWEMKWLSKAVVFRIPFIGWSMRLVGDIPVNRGDKDSARSAMATCGRYLERGMPVMIFPEGTRARTDELLPFKDGAFRLAIEHGAPILPIAVAGTATALPKDDWRFGKARAFVTVGEPIPTRGLTLDDVEALKATTRQRILAMLGTIRPLASKTQTHG